MTENLFCKFLDLVEVSKYVLLFLKHGKSWEMYMEVAIYKYLKESGFFKKAMIGQVFVEGIGNKVALVMGMIDSLQEFRIAHYMEFVQGLSERYNTLFERGKHVNKYTNNCK
jgi:hypothetical protein